MAIRGIELFRNRFSGLQDGYALIGGSACDALFSSQGLRFRATRDLDIVVLTDGPVRAFADALWSFVREGGYTCWHRADGRVHFYRFAKPKNDEYPSMIELFARRPGFPLHDENTVVVPLPVDGDVSSLSAILLDDDYYGFLTCGLIEVEGLSVVDALHIIPLKARAHLDLSRRRSAGERVDSKDLKKHLKDVLRLANLIPIGASIELPEQIERDMALFIQVIREDSDRIDRMNMGVPTDEILSIIEQAYSL